MQISFLIWLQALLITIKKYCSPSVYHATILSNFDYLGSLVQDSYVSPSTYKINPTALRKAKTAHNFGLSECNRVGYAIIFM